jgi:hypothetical protein
MSYLIHRATALLFLCAVVSLPALAQEGATVGEKIRQTQALVQSEFRQILSEDMQFTDEEAAVFWPLYERYSAEKRLINERYLANLIEYVDRYYGGDLTNEHASRLMNSYFDVQLAILDKRRGYVARFGEFLTPIKVMRFYQLENKVNAEINAALALAIPLADPR